MVDCKAKTNPVPDGETRRGGEGQRRGRREVEGGGTRRVTCEDIQGWRVAVRCGSEAPAC